MTNACEFGLPISILLSADTLTIGNPDAPATENNVSVKSSPILINVPDVPSKDTPPSSKTSVFIDDDVVPDQ